MSPLSLSHCHQLWCLVPQIYVPPVSQLVTNVTYNVIGLLAFCWYCGEIQIYKILNNLFCILQQIFPHLWCITKCLFILIFRWRSFMIVHTKMNKRCTHNIRLCAFVYKFWTGIIIWTWVLWNILGIDSIPCGIKSSCRWGSWVGDFPDDL